MNKLLSDNKILLISAIAFVAISSFFSIPGIIFSVAAAILFFYKKRFNYISTKNKKYDNSLCSVIMALGLCFKLSMNFLNGFLYKNWAGALPVNAFRLISLLLCVLAMPFALSVINLIIQKAGDSRLGGDYLPTDMIKPKTLLFLLLSSFIIVTLRSKSSFLYPFNTWVDVNVFMTMGKGITNGLVMYRDVIDQKGPLLYFIYALFNLISSKSFAALYISEIVCCFFLQYFALKCCKLFTQKQSEIIIAVSVCIFYNATSFWDGGSVEELCAPLLAWAVYIMLKSIVEKEVPDFKEGLLIGIIFAAMLMIKFTMVSFFLGFGLTVLALVKEKENIKKLFAFLHGVFAGIALVLIPIAIYFISNNALPDLYQRYIADNLFSYTPGTESSTLTKFLDGFFDYASLSPQTLILAAGFIFWQKKNKKIFTAFLLCFVSTMAITYIGHPYYQFLAVIFICFAAPALTELLPDIILNKKSMSLAFALICVISSLNVDFEFMTKSRDELPQYKFSEIMLSEKDNPTLLNYGFMDGGFYLASGIVPNCKYFCKYHMPNPDMMDCQNYYVDNGLLDFVVTCNENLESNNYEAIVQDMAVIEDVQMNYTLWKLKE